MIRSVLVGLCSAVLMACSVGQGPSAPAGDGLQVDSDWRDNPPLTLLEKVDADDGEIAIPYSKYRLANGLTVIIHEDTSDPLVHVDVTYHVGSAREEPRRSGFAHFFEHMMFQGSAHVDDDEHFKIITEAGGRMNGTTNYDRTNYFETVPSNNLETALWLEADRMGFLLEAVTQSKFEIQRATVKNERGQNVENRPYGRFNEVNNAALYPAGHPYSWPVIGYPQDLDAATLEDLQNFFLRWYGPNNATLTIGGDVEEEQALELVQKYFGSIPPGPEVKDAEQAQVDLDEDRYVSYLDKNIRFPALLFTWPTVPHDHPDRVALECLADVVGGGRKSLLYKQFVLSNKAIDASAFSNTMELAGSLTFFVMPYPGVSLSEMEGEMRELFADFDADSISAEDVQICRASREASMVESLAGVQGKVSRLAYYQTFFDDPDYIRKELDLIRALDKGDVLRAFETYVAGEAAVVQSVVPESDPNGQARPDNYELPEPLPRTESETAQLEPRPVQDDFDRSQRPEPGQAPLVQVPDYWTEQLDNGVELIGTKSDELPLVTLELIFEGGHLLDDPDHNGLANLTAVMMNEGTENYSAEEFEKELQKLGSRIHVVAGSDEFQVNVSSLSRNLDATLDLLEERLLRPRFTQQDLERLRQQEIEAIEANRQQPQTIAGDIYRKLVYGANHSLSVPASGEPEGLRRISLEDVQNYYRNSLATEALQVVVVGDVEKERIIEELAFLDKLPADAPELPDQPAAPEREQTTLYLVDKPGAHQSEIRVGYLTDLTYDATGEYFERYLMNYVLGGAFSSRINLNLREDKGYTYGARSGFSGSKLPGPFTASASVKKEATADAVRQFMKEIRDYREQGITTQELEFMRSAVGQSDALSYETPRQKAGFLARIIQYDLPADFVDQQLRTINSISREDVNRLAREHLPIDEMFILVVGDKEAIGESVRELGYPVVELDSSGRALR
ncbi:M16 family metallopeptidase [Gilvimarinus sp. F26214L]|uniref:M16 family metallopeptidase n=1 Tax=Gilvimarinus sp. DZF01 TaxID=3461371 RepID=UPI0040459829